MKTLRQYREGGARATGQLEREETRLVARKQGVNYARRTESWLMQLRSGTMEATTTKGIYARWSKLKNRKRGMKRGGNKKTQQGRRK